MKTPKKRNREGKTDYKKRFGFMKSQMPRIVVRKTNKFLFVQYVKSVESRDKVIAGFSSKDLIKYGWPKEKIGSLKSIPVAYLLGLYAGKKIVENEKGNVILDIGLNRSTMGGRVYAVLKGLVDSGLKIIYDKKLFPPEERLEGKHLNDNIQKKIKEIKKK
ncbi:MAG: 50S ribosomal protein L18 [Candidatus Pacearchaeota archaeon]